MMTETYGDVKNVEIKYRIRCGRVQELRLAG